MTENVLDVLMYLFETYTDADSEPEADRNALRVEMERAGFGSGEISKALDWLDGLASRDEDPEWESPTERASRVFSNFETSRLDAAARGYIMYLEQIGILSAAQRELVIDRVMALETEEIEGEQIGRHKIRERLGEGGFGIVWAAEQLRPVRRKVALKIIKPELVRRAEAVDLRVHALGAQLRLHL